MTSEINNVKCAQQMLENMEGIDLPNIRNRIYPQEWISVNDRLPKEYERVLIYRGNYEGDDKDELIHVGFLHPKDGFYGSQYGLLDDDLYPDMLVTHWMPLPQLS